MAKELRIYYPFKPFNITQRWGNPNPMYQHFGFKNHNGIDADTGRYNWDGTKKTEYPVYCPVEGFTVHKLDYHPNGGGKELWLISDEPLKMFEQECHAYIPLFHAKHIFVKPGEKPRLGELLMLADNTGFSTGLHTHIGLYRVSFDGSNIQNLDTNDAASSFDPALFFTREYAVDKATVPVLFTAGKRLAAYYAGLQ